MAFQAPNNARAAWIILHYMKETIFTRESVTFNFSNPCLVLAYSKKEIKNIMKEMTNASIRELTNRKIIEDLQLQKKQMLLKQGVVTNSSSTPVTPALQVGTLGNIAANPSDTHAMSSAQRTALMHAHTQSFGFFVTQDSSFGNSILPVLPRFDNNKT